MLSFPNLYLLTLNVKSNLLCLLSSTYTKPLLFKRCQFFFREINISLAFQLLFILNSEILSFVSIRRPVICSCIIDNFACDLSAPQGASLSILLEVFWVELVSFCVALVSHSRFNALNVRMTLTIALLVWFFSEDRATLRVPASDLMLCEFFSCISNMLANGRIVLKL